MNIYILLYIFIILCSFAEINIDILKVGNNKINLHKTLFIILTVIFMFMGIFRDEYLGVDAGNYRIYFFDYVQNMSIWQVITEISTDKAFYLLTKLISLVTDDFWLYTAILYMITFGIQAFVIYKHAVYPVVSYLIFMSLGLFQFDFNIYRQALAVSICCLALDYVKEKNLKRFIIYVLVAALFHQTALMFFVTYPIANWDIKGLKLWKKALLIIAAIIMSRFMPFFYQFYLRNDYGDNTVEGEGYFLLLFLICLLIFITWVVKYWRIKADVQMLYNLSFCLLYFQIGATQFSLFTRVVYYFWIILILLVPEIIARIKNKNVVWGVFIFAFTAKFLYEYNGLEYITIWD